MRTVREIYRLLLARMAELGLPRRPAQTPYADPEAVAAGMQKTAPELATITEAYVLARYGERLPSDEDFEQLRRAWAAFDARLAGSSNPETEPPNESFCHPAPPQPGARALAPGLISSPPPRACRAPTR